MNSLISPVAVSFLSNAWFSFRACSTPLRNLSRSKKLRSELLFATLRGNWVASV